MVDRELKEEQYQDCKTLINKEIETNNYILKYTNFYADNQIVSYKMCVCVYTHTNINNIIKKSDRMIKFTHG